MDRRGAPADGAARAQRASCPDPVVEAGGTLAVASAAGEVRSRLRERGAWRAPPPLAGRSGVPCAAAGVPVLFRVVKVAASATGRRSL